MGSTKHKMFSVWKIIGLVIALGTLGYRICITAVYFDSIVMEWGSMLAVFFLLYLIDISAVTAAFTRNWATLILAGIVTVAAMFILIFDGIFFVAKLFDPSNRTMTEMGYLPLANFMDCLAGFFHIIGFLSIKKRERKARLKTA